MPGNCRGAGGGRENAGENAHGRGFAGPIRAKESDNFASINGEAHIRDGREGAIELREAVGCDHKKSEPPQHIAGQTVPEQLSGINH